ncbi:hypothetical protein ACLMJK_006510 [Lecanora helva]
MLTIENAQVVIFFIGWGASVGLLATPISVMVFYGGWTKWILLAVVALTALLTAAAIGWLTPNL